MRRGLMKTDKNSGVALVTVLLVVAVTVALAYGALSVTTSVLQGSKRAESSVQARLNAESGLDATFVYLDYVLDKKNNDPRRNDPFKDLTHVPSITTDTGIQIDNRRLFELPGKPKITPAIIGDPNAIIYKVVVNGLTAVDDSVYTTNADVFYHPGSDATTDPDASPETPQTIQDLLYRGITSCSVVDVGGGTQVLGGGNIFSARTITLASGSKPVEGNLYTPEGISITSTTITGNVTAGKKITINNSSRDPITGDIRTNQNILINNSAVINGNLFTNGDLTITNTATINGDVYVGGNLIITNTAKIVGNTFVNGRIDLGTWGISLGGDIYTNTHLDLKNNVDVAGSVFAPSGVSLTASQTVVKGNVYSAQNLSVTGGAKIHGSAFVDQGVNLIGDGRQIGVDLYTSQPVSQIPSSRVGGTVVYEANAGSSRIQDKMNQVLPFILSEFGMGSNYKIPNMGEFAICDVPGETIDISQDIRSLKLSSQGASAGISGTIPGSWIITPGKITNTGTNSQERVDLQPGMFAGRHISFMHFREFGISNSAGNKIAISGGDVVLLVDQPISIAKLGNLAIDSDSSLTILTSSQIKFIESGEASTWDVLNDSDKPSLSFYTSYGSEAGQTGAGFSTSGGTNYLNTLVYAPNSSVHINNSEVHGAIVGKSVETSGVGVLRYHQGLLELIGKLPPSNEGEEGLVIVKRR